MCTCSMQHAGTRKQTCCMPGRTGMCPLPTLSQAQQYIYDSQNPADCSSAKYLLYSGPVSGIGSVLHQMGIALGVAVSEGRVLYETEGQHLAIDDFCPPGNKRITQCYFRPSRCTLTFNEEMNSVDWHSQGHHNATRVVRFGIVDGLQHRRLFVPHVFQSWLRGSAIDPSHYFSWWRAQATAYQVQPNERTLAEVEKHRKCVYTHIYAYGCGYTPAVCTFLPARPAAYKDARACMHACSNMLAPCPAGILHQARRTWPLVAGTIMKTAAWAASKPRTL